MEISGKHHSTAPKTKAHQSCAILLTIFTLVLSACGGGGSASSGISPSSTTTSTSGGTADTTRPTVTITTPTTSTTTNSTLSLGGTASDNVGVTQVTWSNSTTGASGTASGTTSWNVNGIALQTGTNSITVQARDAAGNTGSASLTVTYSSGSTSDTTAPTVTITSPTSNSSYTTGSATVSLSGSAADNVGVTQVTWSNNTTGTSGTASGTASWSKSGIALQSGSNTITIKALDAAGNFGTDVLTVTYADLTPPTVLSISPTSSATGISTSATITVTFSEAMSAASINASTFTVNGVSGSISVNGTTATFTPSSALANSTTYTVTVIGGASGVKDASGNALAATYTWMFTTAAATAATDCASSTVLCVDDTAGATQEFSTIQAAANAAQPGDTIVVYDGNYAGFQITHSGTQAAPIVFRANSANVVINRDGPTEGDGIHLQDVSYVTIDGFQVQGVSHRCVAARGATSDSPMTGNIVRNNRCSNAGAECFYLSQFSSALIENNILSNCGASGASKSHGIYLANAGSDNTVIRGNTISGAAPAESEGIHINGDVSIGGDGIVSNLTIENNVIYNNTNNGLSMDGVQNSLIRNNLIYGNGRHAIRAYQIDGMAGPAGLRIVNNTLNGSSGWAIKLSEDLGGHTIFNNVLVGSSGSLCVGSSTLASNNNAAVDKFSVDTETTVISLSLWRTQTGNDANSFNSSSAALFVNSATGDYHLNSTSPAINTGRASLNSIQAPVTDQSGATRPQGTAYDVGAYETSQ